MGKNKKYIVLATLLLIFATVSIASLSAYYSKNSTFKGDLTVLGNLYSNNSYIWNGTTYLSLNDTLHQSESGINGTNEANGINGKNGINGTNGINGENGINGKDGLNANQLIGAYSFLVGVYPNGTYYAQNGKDGSISFVSTNASYTLNSVLTPGNTILIQDGLYIINSTSGIQVPDNVKITGMSKENTILRQAANAPITCPAIISNADFKKGNQNITVSNLQIDGNWQNQNMNAQAMGIQLVHVSYVTIENCYVHDTAHDCMGAWYGSDHCLFINNISANPASHQAIFLETGTSGNMVELNKDCKIVDNLCYGATNYTGIVISGINCLADGNTIWNCKQDLVISSLASNCVVSSNICYNSTAEGIFLSNSTFNDISGNTLYGIGTNGISVVNSNDSSVSNNLISNCGLDGSPNRKGIYVDSGSFQNSIIGNSISHIGLLNKQGEGIECNGYYNSVISNKIFDDQSTKTLWAGIYLISGNNNLITDNQISDTSAYSIYADSNAIINTITNNKGYNPLGYSSFPIYASTGYLVDRGTNSTLISGKIYTNWQSPKILYVSGGTVQEIDINGQNTGLVSGAFSLQPSDTFNCTASTMPIIVCNRQ
jgi:nitrous oxidase accessory protein